MQLLTYSKTTENKLNESYNILNNIKKELGKSNELKIKTKKSTVKDFNIENKNVKESKDNNKLKKYDNNKYYQGFINDTLDNIYFHFYNHIKDEYLTETSEQYLKIKNYKKGANKDYIPTEKTEHTRKKTFVYNFNGNVTKILNDYLINIYKQQKFTFKLTIEFSFLLIKVDNDNFDSRKIWNKNNYIQVDFDLRLASTNTRPDFLKILLL